jgi:hypothetical protein
MLKKSIALVAAFAVSICAIAQTEAPAPAPAQLGTVENVQGLVTVSDGTSIGNVVKGGPVMDGSRFVTSSSGSATLKLDNGCIVALKPSQSLTFQGKQNCDQTLAAIQSLGGNNGVFAALANPLVGLGTLASAALIATVRNGGPISGQ